MIFRRARLNLAHSRFSLAQRTSVHVQTILSYPDFFAGQSGNNPDGCFLPAPQSESICFFPASLELMLLTMCIHRPIDITLFSQTSIQANHAGLKEHPRCDAVAVYCTVRRETSPPVRYRVPQRHLGQIRSAGGGMPDGTCAPGSG